MAILSLNTDVCCYNKNVIGSLNKKLNGIVPTVEEYALSTEICFLSNQTVAFGATTNPVVFCTEVRNKKHHLLIKCHHFPTGALVDKCTESSVNNVSLLLLIQKCTAFTVAPVVTVSLNTPNPLNIRVYSVQGKGCTNAVWPKEGAAVTNMNLVLCKTLCKRLQRGDSCEDPRLKRHSCWCGGFRSYTSQVFGTKGSFVLFVLLTDLINDRSHNLQ